MEAPDRTKKTQPWHSVGLALVLMLATFLHFFRLGQEGLANLYYAATVKSMLTNWHNFFFVSFDPGGFVSVDKPPLGLWLQAISAMLFGFKGWSLLLPQVIAGVLSVVLLYYLVQRIFGPTAGLIAALLLALTPIFVAANRNNTMDSLLVLTSLLAAWAASLAAERGRLRWLLVCALLVGVGFNIKMLQAFMVLPAFLLLYLIAAPLRWWKRLLHLALATVVVIVVSLSWAVIVDSTPADQRPYVGSSSDNSVMELIVGHNGAARMGSLLRIVGLGRKPPGGPPPGGVPPAGPGSFLPSGQPPDGPGANPPLQEQIPNQAPGQNLPPQADGRNQIRQPTDNTGFRDETGGPGPLRLFNRQLAGQISWFLPLAAICWLAAALQTKVKWPLNRRFQALILWGVWLLPQVVFFSYAGLFHRYYLEMMAPAIAALVGAGLVALYVDYHNPGRRGWLLPTTLLITGGIELIILAQFPEFAPWLAPLILGLTLMVAIALVLLRLLNRQRSFVAGPVVAFGLLTLLIAPAIWTMIPVWHGGHAGLPYAGPDLLQERRDGNEVPDMERLIHFLKSRGDEYSYLLATINARQAAPFILITGEPVMALGGFSGGDRILSVEQLESDVLAGKVRFFLLPFEPGARQPAQVGKPAAPRPQADAQNQPPRLQSLQPQAGVPGGNPPPQQRNPQANRQVQLQRWVREFCKPVPPGLWREPSLESTNVQGILWDCGSIE